MKKASLRTGWKLIFVSLNRILPYDVYFGETQMKTNIQIHLHRFCTKANVLRWLRIYSGILRLQNDLSIMVLLTWSLPLSPTITNSDRCFFWTPFSIKTLMRLSTFFNTILLRSPRVANFLSCMYTWKEYS